MDQTTAEQRGDRASAGHPLEDEEVKDEHPFRKGIGYQYTEPLIQDFNGPGGA